jgi:DNA-binding transcriptional LysR family regulator
MFKNDTKLMESVTALAEELHFGRAARRLRISQPMLTKNIQDAEALIGGPLFLRDRKHVVLSDGGRAYVQHPCSPAFSLRSNRSISLCRKEKS